MHGLLSILIWLPIAAGVLVLVLGDRNIVIARWLALLASLATLAFCLPLWGGFDASTSALQFLEKAPWIARFNAYYGLGIDGISLPLIVLTAFMTVPVIIAAWSVIEKRPAQYFAAFLIMEGLMIGVFSATDVAAVLLLLGSDAAVDPDVPHHRHPGAVRAASTPPSSSSCTPSWAPGVHAGRMLDLRMYVLKGGSYSIADLQAQSLTLLEQRWIFFAFLLAFAVKVPMWPVHTWLPDAHVESLRPAVR